MRRVVLAFMAAVLLVPSGAAAGGWWSGIDLDRSTVAVGQRAKVGAEFLFSSPSAAAEARDGYPFYVYLLRDFDYSVVERAMRKRSPQRWWSVNSGADVIKVGRIVLRVSDRNLGRARASFKVPELPRGTYDLMFCDAGCAQPLGDVIPARRFTVADVATARIADRVGRLEKRIRRQVQQLAVVRTAVRAAHAEATSSRSELEQLQAKTSMIEQRARKDRDSSSGSRWAYAGWLIAGALLGALLALLLRSRRSPRTVRDASNGWHATGKARVKELA